MPVARDDEFTGADQRISFVQDRATWHDLSHGAIQQTGNPLDVAIDGNAFLVVQTPRGERYTRNGALQINATGQLVTSEGYQVLGDAGPITFQRTDTTSSSARTASSRCAKARTPRWIRRAASCGSSRFDQPQRLQKDGGSTFVAPAGVDPGPAPRGTRVVQGAIEKSNVRGVVEMTRMIEITRSYTDSRHICCSSRATCARTRCSSSPKSRADSD